MEKKSFDFEAFKKSAQERLRKGDSLLGKEGVLTPLLKEFLEGDWKENLRRIWTRMRSPTERMARVARR